jgi:hypothetical protein
MSEVHNNAIHNYSIHNYDEQIGAVEARIGRLALLCGADLSRPEVVIGLIKGNFAVCGRDVGVDPVHRDELRALLMLKYDIKASCVDSIGTADCARLMAEQDEKLRRRGFPPQAIAP